LKQDDEPGNRAEKRAAAKKLAAQQGTPKRGTNRGAPRKTTRARTNAGAGVGVSKQAGPKQAVPNPVGPENYFAIAAPGLEAVVASELAALGIKGTIVPGGVEFTGDTRALYRANLELRSATRIVLRIATFRARTFFELERHAKSIPWKRFVAKGGTVSFRVTATKSKLYHEGAIAQRLMDALRKSVGASVKSLAAAEDIEEREINDAQMFIVRFLRDECVVSADTSGVLLHMRGYRQAVGKAPLRETLAAALLIGTNWKGDVPLVDPLCGSGTIPIEAALIARRIPPGLANAARTPRDYAFEKWPGFDAQLWADIVNRARGEILDRAKIPIRGSDRDAGAVASAASNAARAGVANDVVFEKAALSAATMPASDSWIVTNPPYGVRVGSGDQRNLLAAMGRLARDQAPDGRVVVLTADAGVDRHAGIPLKKLFETKNGGIAVKLLATPYPVG
jgi:putative N6-adenine-specific DNA methylase